MKVAVFQPAANSTEDVAVAGEGEVCSATPWIALDCSW